MILCAPRTIKMSLSIMLFTILLITISQTCAQQTSDIVTTITINSSGVVYIEIKGYVQMGINFFECPVEPISATIEALLDNEPIPIIYYNNSIIVVSNGNGSATISYVANVTIEDGKSSFYYNSTREAILIIPPNVLLTPESLTLIDAFVKDNKLFLKLKGPALISFVVSKEAGEPGTITPTTPPTSTTTIPMGAEIALYLAIIAVTIGAIIALKKRRSKFSATYLDEVDKAIIEKLRKHGGEVFQGVLYRELSLPKATVWRHIKKLEKMGYVVVERMGRDNKVRLLK